VSPTQIAVALGGAATIAFVNWFFLGARKGARASAGTVTVVVDGGYVPSVVEAPVGKRLRIVFDRRDTSSCSEEVVFPDFGIRRFLPAGEKTAVEITPDRPGRFSFTCGMGMLRGTVVAERS
jgi:plastocyanin domain-containing protein